MIRVLIVDSNIVFAKKVRDFLNENLRECVVDIAQNVPIMKSRLNSRIYDIILADIVATIDSKWMLEELNNTKVPKILWTVSSTNDKIDVVNNLLNGRIFQKPTVENEFDVISEVIGTLNCI